MVSNRFWVICVEHDLAGSIFNSARLHVVVSASTSPNSLGSGDWNHFSFDLKATSPSFNGFADRPGFAVDDTHLYLPIRDAECPLSICNPQVHIEDNRTILLAIPKADMLNGTPPPLSAIWGERLSNDLTWGHIAAIAR